MLHNKSFRGVFLVFLLFLLACFTAVQAAGVKERMLQRLPEIDSMKSRGIIGENNEGFLEFVGAERINAPLVEEENSDRRMVYEAIAAKQKTSVELVGSRRALQIARNAPSGTMLQAPDGEWYKKP